MTRFALAHPTESVYLAACYENMGNGIYLTDKREDCCHYVTVEKAASVARSISQTLGWEPVIEEVI